MTVMGPGGPRPGTAEDPFRGLPTFENAPVVSDDPVPYLTETFERWGAFDTMDPAGHPITRIARALGLEVDIPQVPTTKAMAQVLGATQSLVSALSLNEKHFSVRFAAIQTAATSTDPNHRVVMIGARAMMARGLTNGQRAAIIMGSAYHEVGHVNWSMMWKEILDRRAASEGWSGLKRQWAHEMLNLGHDLMLEWQQARRFPGYANVLGIKNLFNSTPYDVDTTTVLGRYNNGITRCRFPWAADWSGHPDLVEAWDAFKARCETEEALEYEVMLRIIEDGLDLIRPDEPDPEPEEPDDEQPVDEPTEPTDEPPPPGPPQPPQGGGEEPDDDEDEEPEDEEPGDEPGDEDDGDEEPEPGPGDPGGEGDDEGDDTDEVEQPKEHRSAPTDKIDLHGPDFPLDGAWQDDVDEYTRAQVAGRDRRIVGGGMFRKREVRIIRMGRR